MQETTFQINHSDSCVSQRLMLKRANNLEEIICAVREHATFSYLEKTLKYQFPNLELLVQALTHTSFQNEYSQEITDDYEKLEFLGDSFLGLSISCMLMEKFSKISEGELSKMRASLVNKEVLSQLAEYIGLGDLVLLGKGEVQNQGMKKESILADIFEAVLGAIFIESGHERANQVLKEIIENFNLTTKSDFLNLSRLETFDFKSRLQEETMKSLSLIPEYRELGESLTDTPRFKMGIYLGDKLYATAEATSKKLAQKVLAEKVFKEKKYSQ